MTEIGNVTMNQIRGNTIDALKNTESEIMYNNLKVTSHTQFSNKTELYAKGKYEGFVANVSDIGRSAEYKTNLEQTETIMNHTEMVLGNMVDILEDARLALANTHSALGKDMRIDKSVRDHLDQFLSQLNSKFNDKSLFAGYTTDKLPVDKAAALNDSLVYNTTSGEWVATANYARGDMSAKSVQVDDNISVQFNIPANDQAFVKVIGALNQVLKAPEDQENLTKASALLDDAFNDINTLRTDYGLKTKTVKKGIENWTDRNESLQNVHQKEYGNDPATMAELMSDMQELKYVREQTLSVLALLLKNQQSILDRII